MSLTQSSLLSFYPLSEMFCPRMPVTLLLTIARPLGMVAVDDIGVAVLHLISCAEGAFDRWMGGIACRMCMLDFVGVVGRP